MSILNAIDIPSGVLKNSSALFSVFAFASSRFCAINISNNLIRMVLAEGNNFSAYLKENKAEIYCAKIAEHIRHEIIYLLIMVRISLPAKFLEETNVLLSSHISCFLLTLSIKLKFLAKSERLCWILFSQS